MGICQNFLWTAADLHCSLLQLFLGDEIYAFRQFRLFKHVNESVHNVSKYHLPRVLLRTYVRYKIWEKFTQCFDGSTSLNLSKYEVPYFSRKSQELHYNL